MYRSVIGHFFKSSRFTLDNFVFRLHYRVTVGLLLLCAVAILWKITFGVPIRCQTGGRIEASFVNDHCWYNGLFTYPEARNKQVGVEVPAPGILLRDDQNYETHNMHRWVVICILVQAVFFYLPRVLWLSLEGRTAYNLIWNLNDVRAPADGKHVRKNLISTYVGSASFRNLLYVAGHVACEFLNLINVVVQLFLVSHIVKSSTVNLDMLTKSRSERNDTLALESFPMYAKCTFHMIGPHGAIQRHSMLCNISVNGVMETIFICQWIWFTFLASLSALAVLYRVALIVFPQLRSLRLVEKTKLATLSTIRIVTRKLGIGEWFVLYMLSKNVDPIDMIYILDNLSGVLNKEESSVMSVI